MVLEKIRIKEKKMYTHSLWIGNVDVVEVVVSRGEKRAGRPCRRTKANQLINNNQCLRKMSGLGFISFVK